MSPSLAPSSTKGAALGLSPSQLDSFHEDGYLVVPDALDSWTVAKLLSTTQHMLADFSLDDHPMTRFSTGEGESKAHVGDEYFLTSGDKIRYFFEEDAFGTDGALRKAKARAINKIGHALHVLSPPFARVTLSATNAAMARTLGFQDPRVLQSMIICKQPEIGGRVPPHQDSTFLYTDPPSAIGFWYALEDATAANGCLSFAKGSHQRTPVRQRFVRSEQSGTDFVDVSGSPWPHDGLTYEDASDGHDATDDAYTLEEVRAGTLMLIHGNLLHKSERNLSGRSRFIYTFHVIEGKHEYDGRNWLQPSNDGFARLPR